MVELWKDVPGFNGKYQLNTEGKFRRIYKNSPPRLIKPVHKKLHRREVIVIRMNLNGKRYDKGLLGTMAKTFLGECPEGFVPYHVNGCKEENHINNIAYISKEELGKKTGAASRRKPVVKINSDGDFVEFYTSARECGRKNYMSYQTIIDRCNGKCKSAFAPDGYAYAWEDSEISMKQAISKVKNERAFQILSKKVD